jgi:hypothetical protein
MGFLQSANRSAFIAAKAASYTAALQDSRNLVCKAVAPDGTLLGWSRWVDRTDGHGPHKAPTSTSGPNAHVLKQASQADFDSRVRIMGDRPYYGKLFA